jgi:hypothetical protein
MEFLELKYNGKTYTNQREIINILKSLKFYWLIDAEVDKAIVEIHNNTLIWHEGIFMNGDWLYGIFKNGGFYGNWLNGIFEDGYFNGVWNSGIRLNKK